MIRPYEQKDKDELLILIRLNTPQFFDSSEELDLVKYLDTQIEDYYVIEEDGKVVGCGGINYKSNHSTGIISWDIIHPDYQGKGIGRNLLLYRIDTMKKNDSIKKITVRTSQFTFKYYEKFEFVLVKRVKDFWAKGYDLYQMEIILT